MYIQEIDEIELTDFFINDPKLCYAGLDDNDLHILYTEKAYKKHPNSTYYGLFDEDDYLMAVYKCEWFTSTTINAHLYVGTKYQKKGLTLEILRFVSDLIKEHGVARKIVVLTPAACRHVQKCVKAIGFKLEGRLSNTVTWRQKLVDLLNYGYNVYENEV